MKKVLINILFLIGYSTSVFAIETVFDTDNIKQHGIYYSKVLKSTGVYTILGDRVLWVVNKKYSYGIGTYASTTFSVDDASYTSDAGNADYIYKYDYRGFEFEYLFDSDDLFHFNIQSLAGIGTINRDADNVSEYTYITNDNKDASDDFTFAELGAGIELNISEYLRILLNINYFYSLNKIVLEVPQSLKEEPTTPELSVTVLVFAIKIGFYE